MTRAGRRRNLRLALAVAVAATVVVPGVPPATAAGADAGEIIVTRVPGPERRAAHVYWTAERLAAAQPLDVLIDGSAPVPRAASGSIAKKVKKPYTTPSKRTNGVVFGTLPNSFDFRCSGTATEGETQVAVWSAGHCVYNAPAFETCNDPPDEPPGPCEPSAGDVGPIENLVFIPGYKSGPGANRPFGTFPAAVLAVDPQWQDMGNLRFDFGAFTVGDNGDGQALEDVVDGRALVTSYALDPAPQFKAIGYPAQGAFNGNAQFRCRSDLLGQDQLLAQFEQENFVIGAPLPGEDPLRIKCDMTGGSSGGSWRIDAAIGSNVSYGYGFKPNKLYGPYLGSEALAVLSSLP